MKIKILCALLSTAWLAACGGAGDANMASAADPATQTALNAISDRARAESQEPNAGEVSVAGVNRNAQALKRTVLNKP